MKKSIALTVISAVMLMSGCMTNKSKSLHITYEAEGLKVDCKSGKTVKTDTTKLVEAVVGGGLPRFPASINGVARNGNQTAILSDEEISAAKKIIKLCEDFKTD